MNKSLGIYNIIDTEGIKKSINNVLSKNINFNTYSSPKGLKELRIEIGKFITKAQDYPFSPENMLITSGSQQSINIVADALLKDGDTVLIEQPTYFGAIDIFKNMKINLIGIDLYDDGIDLKMLEKNIVQYSPKLIYVTPTFNNPTGFCWSNEARIKFLNIINKYNIMVLEDDPYSLINYTKSKFDSLYKLNHGKNVIYLGTFSKLISPSISVGYVLCNDSLMKQIYTVKKNYDLCTNIFIQYVVFDYLKSNDLKALIFEKTKLYKKMMKKSINEIKCVYNDNIEYISNPKGGIFYLIKFKEKVDSNSFENGSKYYVMGDFCNVTRVNICSQRRVHGDAYCLSTCSSN